MANVGNGNVAILSNAKPPGIPGPPFAISSADNGLTVNPSTGIIQLGNETQGLAGSLTAERYIPLNTFGVHYTDESGLTDVSIRDAQIDVFDGVDNQTNLQPANVLIRSGVSGTAIVTNANGPLISMQSAGSLTYGLIQMYDNGQQHIFHIKDQTFINGGTGITFMGYDVTNFAHNDNGLIFFPFTGAIGIGDRTTLIDNFSSKLIVGGSVVTDAGTLTTAPGRFRIGSIKAAASVLDATKYLETEINGVLVKVCIAT